MEVSALVLRAGDSISARGVIVTDGFDLGLLMGPRHPGQLPGIVLDQPAVVRLENLSRERRGWPDQPARRHRVRGTWSGSSVAVTGVTDEGPLDPLRPVDLGEAPPRALVRVLRELQDRRVLVGIAMDRTGDGSSAAVTATDLRSARQALEPFFDDLVVRRAPHAGAELVAVGERIRSTVPPGILSSFGDSTDRHGFRRTTATVQRVTQEMAAALEDVPESALELTVLLVPRRA